MLIHLNKLASSFLKPTDQSSLNIIQQPRKSIRIKFHVNHVIASASNALAVVTSSIFKKPIATASGFKKPMDTMGEKELQQVIEEKNLHLYFFNDQGEPVCSLCEENFASVKELYHHLEGHPNSDWKAFYGLTPNVKKRGGGRLKRKAEVVDLEKCLIGSKVKKGKRSRLGFCSVGEEQLYAAETLKLLANGDMSSADASSKRRKLDDYKEVDLSDLENLAADCLVLMANGDPTNVELSLSGEESIECKMVHAFDLNEAPPMEL